MPSHELVHRCASGQAHRSSKRRASREVHIQAPVTRSRSQRARMNVEFESEHVQCEALGSTSMLLEDPIGVLQELLSDGTTSAVKRAIRVKRYPEQCGERSLRKAGGQSHVADRRHALHIAIVGRRSEASRAREHSPSVLRSRRALTARVVKASSRWNIGNVAEFSAPGRTRTCDPRLRRPSVQSP